MADENIYNLSEGDTDSHNPIIVHLKPAESAWKEKQEYKTPEAKMRRAKTRKEKQSKNRKRGWVDDAAGTSHHGSYSSSSYRRR